MLTKEEKMDYIVRHYKMMTAKEMATKLGMSTWMVYDYIKQSGVRQQRQNEPFACERKKADINKNPEGEIPKDDATRCRMVRVNRYTCIMVRPTDNAEERKDRFQRLTGLY